MTDEQHKKLINALVQCSLSIMDTIETCSTINDAGMRTRLVANIQRNLLDKLKNL